MSTLSRRAGVDDDIYDLAAYLLDQSEEVAYRFIDAVELTLKELATRPGVGSPKNYDHPALTGMRTWWVSGFPNHLIYYFPLADGIDVVAVMHGSRDAERRLSERVGG
jgi:toxin ParE1/3/4